MNSRIYILITLLATCTIGYFNGAEAPQNLTFKMVEAGTDDGTVKAEIVKILQDIQTSEFVAGVGPEESSARIENRMRRRPFLLCYKEGKLVAGASYTVCVGYRDNFAEVDTDHVIEMPDAAYVGFVFVDKEQRGQGVGTALMCELVAVIKAEQPEVRALHGEVVQGNHRACKFYEFLGARRVGDFFSISINKRCIVYVYTLPELE